MKFIKLFEAFESNILPKTLNFLSEDSKKTFLKKVKSYCDNIDFPYSKTKNLIQDKSNIHLINSLILH